MLIIDAAALDQAAEALRYAGEHLTTTDGRKQLGPSLGTSAYRLHIITALERILQEPVQPSDEEPPPRAPQETWP
jgi:hypothetical protein